MLLMVKDYLKLLGLSSPEKRMKDVELVLRFISFYKSTYLSNKTAKYPRKDSCTASEEEGRRIS